MRTIAPEVRNAKGVDSCDWIYVSFGLLVARVRVCALNFFMQMMNVEAAVISPRNISPQSGSFVSSLPPLAK